MLCIIVCRLAVLLLMILYKGGRGRINSKQMNYNRPMAYMHRAVRPPHTHITRIARLLA